MTLLSRLERTLPAEWYYDPGHYARELAAVWYRSWVCVGREEDVPRPGDFVVAVIGTQTLIVTRDSSKRLRAFHNTCRHRGSLLCESSRGHFANGRIVCPYHTWTYSLEGELVATPVRLPTDDFRVQDYPLYAVQLDTWGGFLFVNLATEPDSTLRGFLGREADALDNWPLADLVSVHQEKKTLACNWKVFWENFSECYHCPRLHPELCRVVPLYRKGVLSRADLPDWQPRDVEDDGRPTVAEGLATWTLDGQSTLPAIHGVDERLSADGMAFASFMASMFIVGHPDYVRSVRMLPKGPESVELTVDWFLPAGGREPQAGQLEHMLKLGRLVIEQDARACELNQQGLKSIRHRHGVLVPQEYAVHEFHQWLRRRCQETC
jgi:Rieske 2Fe-2S family protein